MATQYYTIAKIAGKTAATVLDRFRIWHDARTSTNEWITGQWPTDFENEAERFAGNLQEVAHVPPTLFYCFYVDLWSFNLPHIHLSEYGLLEIWTPGLDLGCLELPLSKAARDHLEDLAGENGQFGEDQLFAKLTLEACDAWSTVVPDGIVIFVRSAIGASVSDEDINGALDRDINLIEVGPSNGG